MATLPHASPPTPKPDPPIPSRTTATGSSTAWSVNPHPDFDAIAQFDTAPFIFTSQTPEPANDDAQQKHNRRLHFNLLDISSEAFAAIFESGREGTSPDKSGGGGKKIVVADTMKSLKIYTLNFHVINKTYAPRGTQLSLTL